MAECRSIFLDWAMFDDHPLPQPARLQALLERHGAAHPDHPMTAILREGLAEAPATASAGAGRAREEAERLP